LSSNSSANWFQYWFVRKFGVATNASPPGRRTRWQLADHRLGGDRRHVLDHVDRGDEVEALVRERQRLAARDLEVRDPALAPLGDRVLGKVDAVRVPAERGEPAHVEAHRAADVEVRRELLPAAREAGCSGGRLA